MKEVWLNSELVYEGLIFNVRKGRARLEDGTEAHREIVEHGGGVGIVPVLGDRVILVRQFRIAVNEEMLEIPAGRIEPGEDVETRARIELEEECGYTAGRMVCVASCFCSPGFTNERDYIYLAFDLVKTEQRLEFDERVELVEVPIAEIDERMARFEFDDGKTIIGLRELQAYLRK
ncbi:MAG: NUDIX hydrolase [Candidatus Hydrogenedentes bacterium]|nr:NUDIX hydrolase [Candidatus Hydrogenedentota bacterium]